MQARRNCSLYGCTSSAGLSSIPLGDRLEVESGHNDIRRAGFNNRSQHHKNLADGGTIHFAPSVDVKWMMGLLAPRLRHTAPQRDNHLGLSDEVVEKTKHLFISALSGGRVLTRSKMYQIMSESGIPPKYNLGYHMLHRAAWDGIICLDHRTEKNRLSYFSMNG